jgi:hypothetical protein
VPNLGQYTFRESERVDTDDDWARGGKEGELRLRGPDGSERPADGGTYLYRDTETVGVDDDWRRGGREGTLRLRGPDGSEPYEGSAITHVRSR